MSDAQESPVIDQLMASELSIAERAAGLSMATLEDPNFPKVDLLGALAWVYEKRQDHSLTYKAYMESHTLQEIGRVLGMDVDDDDDDEEDIEDPTEGIRTET